MRQWSWLAVLFVLFGSGVAQTVVANGGTAILIKDGSQYTTVSQLDLDVRRAYAGQPFSATVTTTTEVSRPDGHGQAHPMMERWSRDGEGRERFERGFLRDGVFQLNSVRLADPVAGYGANLDVRGKTARITRYTPPPYNAANARRTAELQAQARAERATRADAPVVERLPERTIAGMRAEGVRSTYTIPAGREGNDGDVKIVYEAWTSPELKILLASTLDDPRRSKVMMTVTELSREVPAAAMFEVPADFTKVDSGGGGVSGGGSLQ